MHGCQRTRLCQLVTKPYVPPMRVFLTEAANVAAARTVTAAACLRLGVADPQPLTAPRTKKEEVMGRCCKRWSRSRKHRSVIPS